MGSHTQEVAKDMDLSSTVAVNTAWELKCGILELLQELNDNARYYILELLFVVFVDLLEILKLICRQDYTLDLFLSIFVLGSSSELHLNLFARTLPREHVLRLHHLEQLIVVSDYIGTLTFAIFVVNYTH
jgi:hypothetical protein